MRVLLWRNALSDVAKATLALFFLVLLVAIVRLNLHSYLAHQLQYVDDIAALTASDLNSTRPLILTTAVKSGRSPPVTRSCTHSRCANVYKCSGAYRKQISVYIYPYRRYADSNGNELHSWSREFAAILHAVRSSRFYTPDPSSACLFLPSIDTLSNHISLPLTQMALRSLKWWNDGQNHLIFTPAVLKNSPVGLDQAILAAAGLEAPHYRPGFDVALPSPIRHVTSGQQRSNLRLSDSTDRQWRLIWLDSGADRYLKQSLYDLIRSGKGSINDQDSNNNNNINNSRDFNANDVWSWNDHDKILVLKSCAENSICDGHDAPVSYPNILQGGEYCLLLRTADLRLPNSSDGRESQLLRGGSWQLLDQLSSGCVPVIVDDSCQLPFADVIDWSRAVVRLHQINLHLLPQTLSGISAVKADEMRRQGLWLYRTYFSSFQQMALTTLQLINDRFLPHLARTYHQWNQPAHLMAAPCSISMPYTAPPGGGFTAVVLSYDRPNSLFTLINRLARVPSLAKIVVVWNNVNKSPPSDLPAVEKPVTVIRAEHNRLSNRFVPYAAIETECVFSIDDDIIMLNSDELEFGYQIWREFPDRIVGFPSRTVVWQNESHSWRYNSEWTTQLSLILTGAAFYHKYWHYEYTHGVAADLRRWVDDIMNCEDLLMNFIVANLTGKPPIKVLSRKKFKCVSSTSEPSVDCSDGISDTTRHFVDRSACVERLHSAFAPQMTLRSAEFRVVPVLFREAVPESLKQYQQVDYL